MHTTILSFFSVEMGLTNFSAQAGLKTMMLLISVSQAAMYDYGHEPLALPFFLLSSSYTFCTFSTDI
jgi:hypothetical protein